MDLPFRRVRWVHAQCFRTYDTAPERTASRMNPKRFHDSA
jgi:hypothetical protein